MNMTLPTKEDVIQDMINNPSNYAAIYARQSNPKQSNSIPSQIVKCKEVAVQNNLTVFKVYAERVGATEKYSETRTEFTKLLEDAKLGYFKNLIVFRRDRLTRRMDDFIEIRNLLSKLGVKIIYSNEDEFQSDGSYISNFVENVIMAVSVFEPNNTADRTKAGREKQREAGEYSPGGAIPYGLSKVTDKNEFPDRDSNNRIKTYYKFDAYPFKVIKKVFEAFNSSDIKEKLAIYPKILESISPCKIDEAEIKRIISKPIYAGLQTKNLDLKYSSFRLKDKDGQILKICDDYFHGVTNILGEVPINSRTWFKAVNKWIHLHYTTKTIGKPKKQRSSKNYLLKGILYCEKCNHKIYLSGKKYSCRSAGCISKPKNELDKEVLKELLKDIIKSGRIEDSIDKKIDDLIAIRKELSKELVDNTSKQNALVERYIKDSKDKELKELINKNIKKEESLRSDLTNNNRNIDFFSNNFKEYVSSIGKDIDSNEELIAALLTKEELLHGYIKDNYEKVVINEQGEKIGIWFCKKE